MLPAYSPFLNIVEQAISSLKAAIKGDVQARMEDRAEARHLGIPPGEMRPRFLLDALLRCIVIGIPFLNSNCKVIIISLLHVH